MLAHMITSHSQPPRNTLPRPSFASPRRGARTAVATTCLLTAVGLFGGGCSRHSPTPGSPGVGVTPPSAALRPGEKAQFESVLLPRASWQVVEGYEHGVVTADGEYQAPYFSPDSRSATVRASAALAHSDAHVTLTDGPADRDACFGKAQAHLPSFGEYVFVEELPEALYRVAPAYPEPARTSGVEGTVMVAALVCSSGQVIDTALIRSIPLLDEAAKEAVRHWVFTPAKANGEPIAVWVDVPVKFSLH